MWDRIDEKLWCARRCFGHFQQVYCAKIDGDVRMKFTVAIDGPAAAGKGTIAKAVAAHFGFAHLDSGLLYRAVGRKFLDGKDAIEAANRYGVVNLKLAVETALVELLVIIIQNVMDYLLFADAKICPLLKESMQYHSSSHGHPTC